MFYRKIAMSLIVTLALAVPAHADMARENDTWITRFKLQTETGAIIPVGAYGIITIERPRQATLLDLRGIAGRGDVVLRGDKAGQCLMFLTRFVAGDFGGDTISAHLASPVHLVLKSRRIAKALANGRDVVSDGYRISEVDHPDADIIIKAGLSEDFGFVLNPGRNIMGDIFGIETSRIECAPM